jgi:Zn-finger nucleic acid-binding protein
MCPDTTLLMADRQGVEVDYCPQCRSVWLDRGELDKLLALDVRHAVAPTAPTRNPHRGPDAARERRDFEDSDFGRRHGGQRRKSWLSDIFD